MRISNIEFPLKSKLVPESSRRDRSMNIANVLASFGEYVANSVELSREAAGRIPKVSTRLLRQIIRRGLCAPDLTGEAMFGDLRAHGDALGGHGLRLTTERKGASGERYIAVGEDNYQLCKRFLNEGRIDAAGLIWE